MTDSSKPEPSEEFQRFDDLVGKLLRSPKAETNKVDPVQSPKRSKEDRKADGKV
jgi:hypothetical protein